jgi:hypothetical protein
VVRADKQDVSLSLQPDEHNPQQRALREIKRHRGFRADDPLRLRIAIRGVEVLQLNHLDSELSLRRDSLHWLAAFGYE